MTARSRQRLSLLVRLGICAAAIAWIAWTTEWKEFKQVLRSVDAGLLVLAVAAFGPTPIIIAFRLKMLLAVHQVELSSWQAIKVTFAGNFITNALPLGTGGGDAAKAYYIARDTPHKHEAVTTVFFDRVIGVLSLIGLAGIMLLVNWRNPAFSGFGQVVGIAALVLVVGMCVYFSRRMRRLFRLEKIVAAMPFAAHVQRVDQAAFAFRHHIRRLVVCMVLTVVLQVGFFITLFLAGWALGLVGDDPLSALPAYLGYSPICLLGGALPLGGMEFLFVQCFARAAQLGPDESAVLLSFAGRLIQLTWALPGALVVLSAGRPQADADQSIDQADNGP